jgi:hypothetical protein
MAMRAPTAREGRGAIRPRRAQLHLRPPVRRPRAAQPSRAADQAALAPRHGPAALLQGSPLSPQEVRIEPVWTYRSSKARRELGGKPRPHEETLEANVGWHLEREYERSPALDARNRSSTGSRARRSGRSRTSPAPRRSSGAGRARCFPEVEPPKPGLGTGGRPGEARAGYPRPEAEGCHQTAGLDAPHEARRSPAGYPRPEAEGCHQTAGLDAPRS